MAENTAASSIGKMAVSCGDLHQIGHIRSGLFSSMGNYKIETVYLRFYYCIERFRYRPDLLEKISRVIYHFFWMDKKKWNDSFAKRDRNIGRWIFSRCFLRKKNEQILHTRCSYFIRTRETQHRWSHERNNRKIQSATQRILFLISLPLTVLL
jgi:hypothetical protein